MADLLFVAVILVFFALCVLLVKACDRIIGPDETSVADTVGSALGEEPSGGELAGEEIGAR
jgi:hypothetical protein